MELELTLCSLLSSWLTSLLDFTPLVSDFGTTSQGLEEQLLPSLPRVLVVFSFYSQLKSSVIYGSVYKAFLVSAPF